MEKVEFFRTPREFRQWLMTNHAKAQELWVGFYKVDSGRQSITWKESVDQALCFGWIDGVRKSIDSESYKIRFTPRGPKSNWSKVNVKRYGELLELGLIHSAGTEAYEATSSKRRDYSYEQEKRELTPEFVRRLKKNKKAWEYFSGEAKWYQRTACFWVMCAKKEETQRRRLEQLIADCEKGRRIGPILTKEKRKV